MDAAGVLINARRAERQQVRRIFSERCSRAARSLVVDPSDSGRVVYPPDTVFGVIDLSRIRVTGCGIRIFVSRCSRRGHVLSRTTMTWLAKVASLSARVGDVGGNPGD